MKVQKDVDFQPHAEFWEIEPRLDGKSGSRQDNARIMRFQIVEAAFTPTLPAIILDVFSDEKEYTRALSLSRLAYGLETVVIPILAAAFLMVISFHNLFAGIVVGFLASAALVVSVALPSPKATKRRGIYDQTTCRSSIYR